MKNIPLKEKKALLEALSTVIDHIDYKINDLSQVYEMTDEMRQDTRYDYDKHERIPLFDDNDEPIMVPVYEYVTKPFEELDEDAQTAIKAYQKILKEVEKLI